MLTLGGLEIMFSLFEEVSETTEHYTMGHALVYVLLNFPRFVYELLPLSSLIGALVGLGILAGSNELMVMQAAGITVGRVVWSVMKPTIGIMIFSLVLGEYIAPRLQLMAEVGKAMAGEEVALSQRGYWLKDGRMFLHANAIEPGGVMHGITLYTFDENRQPISNHIASSAYFSGKTAEGNLWQFEDVSSVYFNRAIDTGLNGNWINSTSEEFNLGLDTELLEVLVMDADNMSISDLKSYAGYFDDQGQDAGQYYLAYWKKVFQPLSTAALVLVAISFIFGPLRSSTMGSRLFTAICFGMFFVLLQRFLNTISLVYKVDPMLSVLLPVLMISVLGVWLLRRAA